MMTRGKLDMRGAGATRIGWIVWCVSLALWVPGCPPAEQVGGDEPEPPGQNDGGADGDNTPPTDGTPPADVPPDNTPPGNGNGDDPDSTPTVTANAGPDRTVEDGAQVTLNGSGSDSSGAPVSYAWTQTGGPAVTLVGGATPNPSLVAPAQNTTLTFRLQVQSASGVSSDEVSITVRLAPILFVVNLGGSSITRYRAGGDMNGNVTPLGVITGPATLLNGPTSVVTDGVGGILVTNGTNNRVAGFLNALTATGNIVPERYIGGTDTLLNTPEGAAYAATNDLLYVSNFDSFPGSVNVYAAVSTAAFNGNVAPTRRIRSIDIQNSRDIELTATDELYVVNSGGQNVSVFAGAGTLDGTVVASRVIRSPEFSNKLLFDAELDGQGNLLVVDSSDGRVLVFAGAAGLDGEVMPTRILTVPGAGRLAGIVVDAAGNGYVSDEIENTIYIYSSIAALNGALPPTREISGPATTLSVPGHMHLVPR